MTGAEIGPILGALAVSAAGSAANYALQSSAQGKAQRQRNAAILLQSQMTSDNLRKNVDNTVDNAQQYEGDKRLVNLDKVGNQQTAQLTDALKTAEARDAGPTYGGKVTTDYLVDNGKAAAENLRYGRNLAQLMGRARAPGVMFQGENVNNANTAVENATNDANLNGQLGVSNVKLNSIQPSGGMMAAGDLVGGLSSAYAGAKLANAAGAPTGAGRSPRYTPGTTNYWAPTFRKP